MIVAIGLLVVLGAGGACAVYRTRRIFKSVATDRPPDPQANATARKAAVRLTSGALRALPSPPWRVVYEIGPDRLTGAEHVLLGPSGAFAVTTTIEPLPHEVDGDPDPVALARAAMTRGGLDDALNVVRLASTGLLAVHWGGAAPDSPPAVPGVHGVTHLDGRVMAAWLESLGGEALSASQVDQAWQAVTLAIGRPDPLP